MVRIKVGEAFEKLSALLFLLLLMAMVALLVYAPIPESSEQVILIIIGGLMSTAATTLPRLFGVDDREGELESKIDDITKKYDELCTEYSAIKAQYDRLVLLLVKKYVVRDMSFGEDIDSVLVETLIDTDSPDTVESTGIQG